MTFKTAIFSHSVDYFSCFLCWCWVGCCEAIRGYRVSQEIVRLVQDYGSWRSRGFLARRFLKNIFILVIVWPYFIIKYYHNYQLWLYSCIIQKLFSKSQILRSPDRVKACHNYFFISNWLCKGGHVHVFLSLTSKAHGFPAHYATMTLTLER